MAEAYFKRSFLMVVDPVSYAKDVLSKDHWKGFIESCFFLGGAIILFMTLAGAEKQEATVPAIILSLYFIVLGAIWGAAFFYLEKDHGISWPQATSIFVGSAALSFLPYVLGLFLHETFLALTPFLALYCIFYITPMAASTLTGQPYKRTLWRQFLAGLIAGAIGTVLGIVLGITAAFTLVG